MPKYLGYFERLLEDNGGAYVTGRRLTYVDLSLFQIVDGLRYAFPKRMKAFERRYRAWSTCTTASPRGRTSRPISPATAASPSTTDGIFRHYKELDLTKAALRSGRRAQTS